MYLKVLGERLLKLQSKIRLNSKTGEALCEFQCQTIRLIPSSERAKGRTLIIFVMVCNPLLSALPR